MTGEQPGKVRTRRQLRTARTEAFSDGVLTIASTLPVIELGGRCTTRRHASEDHRPSPLVRRRPTGHTDRALGPAGPGGNSRPEVTR
ncbi:hypothetical protein [Kitasatospora purpeofusca]|uniref:hypothetical protein n=1 Tax=Kitasatospora purpeofusca TaxID=67352 RepID=UPI003865C3BB|nr:TMEM175 family protein [Kitasatospora purpeofusca]